MMAGVMMRMMCALLTLLRVFDLGVRAKSWGCIVRSRRVVSCYTKPRRNGLSGKSGERFHGLLASQPIRRRISNDVRSKITAERREADGANRLGGEGC